MKRVVVTVILFIFIIGVIVAGAYLYIQKTDTMLVTPLGEILKEKPLEKYSIENLTEKIFPPTPIVFDEVIATASSYTEQKFHFSVGDPTSSREAGLRGAGKKVSGLAHLPEGVASGKKFPVIVQLRGYVSKETYASGVGTKRSAEVFASNGYISLAPDFLGYGESDGPSDNAFEDRFLTYTTALQLLSSLSTIPFADTENIFVWGHSNGGQIALTLMTILGEKGYPTTLWAPVSKPFPFSILAYTDEFEDKGKALRKSLSEFEKDYDVDRFTFTNYSDRVKAPLQIQQGGADEEVPIWWSNEFVNALKKEGKTVVYKTYPGADHNMNGAWNEAVAQDLRFFQNNTK